MATDNGLGPDAGDGGANAVSRMRVPIFAATVATAMVSMNGLAADRADPSARLTGTVWTYVAGPKDTLRSIGSRAGIDPGTITHDNTLKTGASVKPGTELQLDNRHITPPQLVDRTIVINVPQRMVFYADGPLLLGFPIAVGSSGWRTPLGPFSIREKELDPTWDVPASIAAEALAKGSVLPARVPPGLSNPLGKHYMATTTGSVGIHGTNAPSSIYQASTHGCIRVHPDDIRMLFERVDVGSPGEFVYEPVLLAIEGGEVFLEVHPDIYRRRSAPLVAARELSDAMEITHLVDWTQAARVAADRHGIARVVTLR